MKMLTPLMFVEDDDVIREATQLALERDGFSVTAMPDGLSGLAAFRADQPDIALLDVMLPGLDGVSLCRRIRDESTVPVIMLSARADSIDVVLGLEAGADDYVTKSFQLRELIARMHAVRRRMCAEGTLQLPVLRIGELELGLAHRILRKAGKEVHLSPKEFELLAFLARHPNRVLTLHAILTAIWGAHAAAQPEHLWVLMAQLRKKIEPDPGTPRYLLSEPWVGYRLVSSPV